MLLTRHFDKQFEDFTVIQKDAVRQIQLTGITSPDIFRGEMATLEWHEVLRVKAEGYSDVAGVNLFDRLASAPEARQRMRSFLGGQSPWETSDA